MTVRLSIRSFAGIARTDVAVGTVSEASILCTTRAPTPRIVSTLAAAGVATSFTGCATGSAGVGVAVTRGCETVGWDVKAAGVEAGIESELPIAEVASLVADFGCGGTPPRGAPAVVVATGVPFLVEPFDVIVVAAEGEKLAALNSEELKNSRQLASTEFGSAMNFSYISSTSQSLAPKFPLTESKPIGAH